MEAQFRNCSRMAGAGRSRFNTLRLSAVREAPCEPRVVWERLVTASKLPGYFRISYQGEADHCSILHPGSEFQLTRFYGWPIKHFRTTARIQRVVPREQIDLAFRNRWWHGGLSFTIHRSRPNHSLLVLVEVWRSPLLFLIKSRVENRWLAASHGLLQALSGDH